MTASSGAPNPERLVTSVVSEIWPRASPPGARRPASMTAAGPPLVEYFMSPPDVNRLVMSWDELNLVRHRNSPLSPPKARRRSRASHVSGALEQDRDRYAVLPSSPEAACRLPPLEPLSCSRRGHFSALRACGTRAA